MTKNTLLHFSFISYSNIKRFALVNMLFVVPILLFLFAASQLIPLLVRYIDSLNITILEQNPDYTKFVLVLMDGADENGVPKHHVYIFQRRDFNTVRRYIFLFSQHKRSKEELQKKSIGFSEIPFNTEPVSVYSRSGQKIVTFRIERLREGSVEILFYNNRGGSKRSNIPLLLLLLILSFITITGSLGGISDFTQRVVFHETKKFSYLFKAIKRAFMRSIAVSGFFAFIVTAIAANIYFYIFYIISDISVFIAAVNFWMLLFFVFILIWVYPLLVLNRDDSIWKVMKKSLYVAFDNFGFTLNALLFVLILFIMSVFTLFLFPGLAGTFSYLNSAMKEISSHYSKTDMT